MFLSRKTFLFVLCMLSHCVSNILSISEAENSNDGIHTNNGVDNDGSNHDKHTMTITNLQEETDIPIGYQNPYERDGDVVDDDRVEEGELIYKGNSSVLSRSQIILMRWPRIGMPIFYADNYSPQEECYIKLGIERLSIYSCIPLKLFKVEESCIEERRIDYCLLRNRTAWNKRKILKVFGNPTIVDHAVMNKEGRSGKSGCRSNIGRIGLKQFIRLSSHCFETGIGTVMHETLHALGYSHEHVRLDRDDHVIIVTENIGTGLKNFEKKTPDMFKDFGPYDYYSIMHYSAYANTKNGEPTIKLKNENDGGKFYFIGQRVDLTQTDKAKIRAVTRCPGNNYDEHLAAVIGIDKADKVDVKDRLEKCRLLSNK